MLHVACSINTLFVLVEQRILSLSSSIKLCIKDNLHSLYSMSDGLKASAMSNEAFRQCVGLYCTAKGRS